MSRAGLEALNVGDDLGGQVRERTGGRLPSLVLVGHTRAALTFPGRVVKGVVEVDG